MRVFLHLNAAGLTTDVQGHRGGRDLRPENILPAFKAGFDNLITTIETDTGVTKDGVSQKLGHAPSPDVLVRTLAGAVRAARMDARCDI